MGWAAPSRAPTTTRDRNPVAATTTAYVCVPTPAEGVVGGDFSVVVRVDAWQTGGGGGGKGGRRHGSGSDNYPWFYSWLGQKTS